MKQFWMLRRYLKQNQVNKDGHPGIPWDIQNGGFLWGYANMHGLSWEQLFFNGWFGGTPILGNTQNSDLEDRIMNRPICGYAGFKQTKRECVDGLKKEASPFSGYTSKSLLLDTL